MRRKYKIIVCFTIVVILISAYISVSGNLFEYEYEKANAYACQDIIEVDDLANVKNHNTGDVFKKQINSMTLSAPISNKSNVANDAYVSGTLDVKKILRYKKHINFVRKQYWVSLEDLQVRRE